MDYVTLYNEITDDPAGLGYAGKTDAQIAALLNAETQEIARTTITAAELWENTDLTEYKALSAAERDAFWGLCGLDSIDVAAGTNSRAALSQLFPAGSTTRENLVALLQTPVMMSRAAVLGLGRVKPGHVAKARGGE